MLRVAAAVPPSAPFPRLGVLVLRPGLLGGGNGCRSRLQVLLLLLLLARGGGVRGKGGGLRWSCAGRGGGGGGGGHVWFGCRPSYFGELQAFRSTAWSRQALRARGGRAGCGEVEADARVRIVVSLASRLTAASRPCGPRSSRENPAGAETSTPHYTSEQPFALTPRFGFEEARVVCPAKAPPVPQC